MPVAGWSIPHTTAMFPLFICAGFVVGALVLILLMWWLSSLKGPPRDD